MYLKVQNLIDLRGISMKNKFFKVTLAMVGTILSLGLGVNLSKANSRQVIGVGSTALQPLAEQVGNRFSDKYGVDVSIQGGGSGTGLSQVQAGSINIGNSDVFAEEQGGIDAKKLQDHKVAVVGIAPVVNKNVKVNNLTSEQLKKIFTGKITNWKQVGGKNQKIVLVNRAKGSGTRKTFENSILKASTAKNSQEQDSNGTVQKIVAQTPGAISYLAFSYVNANKADGIKSVNIDGVKPNYQNVTTNKWKIWSYEHMYTKGKATGNTKKYIDYVESKSIQKTLVKKLGYISINDMKVSKNAKGDILPQK